jgi:dsRNA-specific ribonuclease
LPTYKFLFHFKKQKQKNKTKQKNNALKNLDTYTQKDGPQLLIYRVSEKSQSDQCIGYLIEKTGTVSQE